MTPRTLSNASHLTAILFLVGFASWATWLQLSGRIDTPNHVLFLWVVVGVVVVLELWRLRRRR